MANILLEIPLTAIPNQMVSAIVNGQQYSFKIYLQNLNLYCDIYIGSQLIVGGNLASNAAYINQYPTPITGFFFWYTDDGQPPIYQNLGTTAHLLYANYDALGFDYAAFVAANLNPIPPIPSGISSLLILQNSTGLGHLRVDPSDTTKILGIKWS